MSNAVCEPDNLRELLWSDLPTEEIPARPSYLAEEPQDVVRQEYVALTPEEHLQLRPDDEPETFSVATFALDGAAAITDRLVVRPLGFLLENLGYIVVGGALLVGLAFAADWLIDVVMQPFAPIGD